MKKISPSRTLLVLMATVTLAAPPILAGDAAAVVGIWDTLASTPDGELPGVMTITEDDGVLVVEMDLGGAKRRVSDEALEGHVLTMTVLYDGMPYEVAFTVDGDAMEGTYSGSDASGSVKAKRRP